MSITIDQARAFCAVVENGGYTQAANRLNRSHTSIVYLIKSLEDQLNLQVFNRDKYRNKLTNQGQRIYQKCKEILLKVNELDSLCANLHNHWEPTIRIVFDGALSIQPFIDIYKDFKSDSISTVVQTYTDFLEGVEATFEKLDADMMVSVCPIQLNDVVSFDLARIKFVLVAHTEHALHSKNKRWTETELKDFHFLTVHGNVRQLGLNTARFEESASFFLSDFSFKKEAILKKLGFGWLPTHLIENELRKKTVALVKWDRSSESWIQPVLHIRRSKENGPAIQLIKKRLIFNK